MISVLDCGSSGLVGIPLPFFKSLFYFLRYFCKADERKDS